MRFRKSLWLSIFVTLALSLGLGWVGAQAASKPAKADWQFHDIVSVSFVKQQVKIPMPDNVMIIDSRPYKPKYIKGHIPTAVNIPHSKFDELKGKLPKDKDALLIFYCGGLK